MNKVVLALLALYLIWGSTYLGIHYALESFPPLAMSGTRFVTAGGLLWAFRHGHPTRPAQWASAWLVGALLLVSGNGLVAWAEQFVTSGQAALLGATAPLWIALWGCYRQGYPGHATVAGLGLAMLGLSCLLNQGAQWSIGSLAVLMASLSWAAGSLLGRSLPRPEDSAQFSAMTMLCAGGTLLVLSALSREQSPGAITATAVAAWSYLVVVGSVVGLTTYTWLIQNASPTLVSTHNYVNPVVAVVLSGWAGESLPEHLVGSLLLILGGVAMVGFGRTHLPEVWQRSWIPMVGVGRLRHGQSEVIGGFVTNP